MARQAIGFGLVLAVVAVFWAGAAAQSSSCTSVLISMSPCLNYVTGNSSTPSSSCCTQLANVVKSQPQCLCEALNGGSSSLGITVNQTRALALPAACNVQTQSASRCNGASPTASPSGTSSSTSTDTDSKTLPSTDSSSSSSDATSTKMTMSLLFFLLFIASYASTSTIG